MGCGRGQPPSDKKCAGGRADCPPPKRDSGCAIAVAAYGASVKILPRSTSSLACLLAFAALAPSGFSQVSLPTPIHPPTISSVSPKSGEKTGGTKIRITGANLTGVTAVRVGGRNAKSFVVVNRTTITAITPSGTEGLADVTVTGPRINGIVPRAAALRKAFNYTWYSIIEKAPTAAVVPNAGVRASIVATGLPWRVRDPATGIEMLLVPPGTFTMGARAFDAGFTGDEEKPRHQVTLTRAFYLGRYEVTQAQWQTIMGSNPSQHKSRSDSPRRPVERVSWENVADFNSRTGLRLPTEAEWEYACRAGTTTAIHSSRPRPNGANSSVYLYNIAWFEGNSGLRTHAVGGKDPNSWGFYDMSGNVAEYCNDWFGSYAADAATDPTGPSTEPWSAALPTHTVGRLDTLYDIAKQHGVTADQLLEANPGLQKVNPVFTWYATGQIRAGTILRLPPKIVLRGGDWWAGKNPCRSSARERILPTSFGSTVGFRVARNPRPLSTPTPTPKPTPRPTPRATPTTS